MTNDNDMIRRGDADSALAEMWRASAGDFALQMSEARKAIAALPTVTVGVRPLVWEHDGTCFRAIDPATGQTRLAMDAERAAASDADRAARILAALDLKPAPDAPAEDRTAKGETTGQLLERLGADGSKWAAEFRTTALRLGYSDMDEGWLIGWFCNAIMAGHDRQPAPDAAAIREAALREAADAIMPDDMTWRGSWYEPALHAAKSRVLALLPKKGGA